jgi:hypothetical protein
VERIGKKWLGLVNEAFTDADTFLATLPQGAMGSSLSRR